MRTALIRAIAIAVAAAAPAAAQSTAAGQFETGRYYAGPRIWIGNLNGSAAVGGQVERGFTTPGRTGRGSSPGASASTTTGGARASAPAPATASGSTP
jgi:hypothetical protein